MQNQHVNPYLEARREWNERYGDYIQQAYHWRLIALVFGVITLVSVLGLVYIGSKSKFIPYIVEVDKLGAAIAVQPADSVQPVDARVMKAMLARFITDTRSVLLDSVSQKKAILNAYSMLAQNTPATNYVNDYFQDGNNPFERVKRESVSVEINTVLALSKNTWQIEWTEIIQDRSGIETGKCRMKAIANVIVVPPHTEDRILNNPIGLFIKDLNWTKQLL